MNNLIARTLSGIALILIVGGSILLSKYSMLAFVLIIYSLGIYEFKNMFQVKKRSLFIIALVTGLLFILFNYFWITSIISNEAYFIAIIAIVTVLSPYYLLFNKTSFIEIGKMLFGGIWVSTSLSFLLALGWVRTPSAYSPQLIVIVIALIWVNDIGAYVVGSLIGKNPLAPTISPGKTWEGFISGIILNTIAAYFVFKITGEYSIIAWIILGIIVSLGATVGDLFESKLKREAKVKDSGNLIPGHGGILDRFDSMLFAAPLFYLILLISDKL
jgi:phosphatidate cytidylyltransferase